MPGSIGPQESRKFGGLLKVGANLGQWSHEIRPIYLSESGEELHVPITLSVKIRKLVDVHPPQIDSTICTQVEARRRIEIRSMTDSVGELHGCAIEIDKAVEAKLITELPVTFTRGSPAVLDFAVSTAVPGLYNGDVSLLIREHEQKNVTVRMSVSASPSLILQPSAVVLRSGDQAVVEIGVAGAGSSASNMTEARLGDLPSGIRTWIDVYSDVKALLTVERKEYSAEEADTTGTVTVRVGDLSASLNLYLPRS